MKRRVSNYGPDVFFRRVRKVVRYTFICLLLSLLIGTIIGLSYATYLLPEDSWSLIPDYAKHLIKWKVKGQAASGDYVNKIQSFFNSHIENLWASVWVGFLGVFGSGTMLSLFFWKIGKKNQEDSILRGAEIVTPKQLDKLQGSNSQFGFLNGYNLGKKSPRIWEEYLWRGVAIVGRPGTGKSNLLRIMMEQDLERDAKWFIIDINGDYWRRFGRPGKDKILSLRHQESELWDIKNEDVVPSLLASFFVEKSNAGPSFWWKAGRAVMTSLIEQSKNNEEFKKILLQSDGNLIKLLEKNQDLVRKVLGKEGSGQSAGVLGNAVLDFGFLKDLGYWARKSGKTEPFSITNWATNRDDTSWVYVVVRDDELEEIKPLIGCWFNLAINGCFLRDEEAANRGVYPSLRFGLDELKSLGRLEALEKAGERLRKYRGAPFIGYQNNPQLDAIYGRDGAKNLKDVLQCKVIYSIGDPDAQEELSRLLGEQEIEETHSSTSYGHRNSDSHNESRRITRRPIVLGSEIGKLLDGEAYFKIGPFDPTKAYIGFKRFPNINDPLKWEMPPKQLEASKENQQDDQEAGRKQRALHGERDLEDALAEDYDPILEAINKSNQIEQD